MKRWVMLGAALGMLGAAAPAKPANYDGFGIALLQRLVPQAKNDNVFISPLSIGLALSMAANGAKGATRTAIVRALALSGSALAQSNATLMTALARNTDARVGVANAIWLRRDVAPRASYVKLLKSSYHAQAQALQFGDPSAAAAINAWTKAHTLGLIDRIVGQTNKSDFAYLTNALAFQADWAMPFEKNNTRPRTFTNAGGTQRDVPMMSQTATFQTLDGNGYRALRMPYGKGGFAAYILLPDQTAGLQPTLKALSASSFNGMVQRMQPQRLNVIVPRFTARYDTSLAPVLKSLGMGIAFTGGADFSPMHAPPPGLTISDVRHAAYVRVDEKGTTAAAATAVRITMTSVQMRPKQFIVDHPFILALRDEKTGTLLFLGAIQKI